MLGMIHNILQFTQFFRSRHNFKNWRLHEFTKMNDFWAVPLMKLKHNEGISHYQTLLKAK